MSTRLVAVRHPLLPVQLVVIAGPYRSTATWWWRGRLLWRGLCCEA